MAPPDVRWRFDHMNNENFQASTQIQQIIAAAVYADGVRLKDIPISGAGEWARRPEHVVWIGLHEPEFNLLRLVQAEFGLHDLAIEDALKAHQRPKLELYGETLFIVARTAQMAEGRPAFGETHIFIGRGFVVTVRHGASASYGVVRQRCEANPSALTHGEDYILYAIMDFIVDNYSPVIDAIEEQVAEIEECLFSPSSDNPEVKTLYSLRRSVLQLRNAAVPLVDVCRRLEQGAWPGIDPSMQPLFRDISDHIRRVQEEIDSLREILTFAFEASVVAGQASQTAITRKLAAWAAILAVPTAIAGIYGMNFEVMPELRWRFGYPAVLGVIALLCGALFILFRRYRWL